MSASIVRVAILVLGFDAAWAWFAAASGLNFGTLAWVSLVFYGVAGYCAARQTHLWNGVFGGLFVAAVDATFGWAIASAIGPGHPSIDPLVYLATVLAVVGTGALCGLVGAVVSRAVPGRA